MSPKLVILSVVGATAIAAAGIGGYVALRMNTADQRVNAPAVVASPAQAPEPAAAATEASAPAKPAAVARAVASRAARKPGTASRRAAAAAKPTVREAAPAPSRLPVAPPPPPPSSLPAIVSTSAQDTSSLLRYSPGDLPTVPPARFDELTVKADSVVGIRLDSTVSTETARVEDKVTARVARDVTVNGRTAISAGARLEGVVTLADRGGRFKGQSRLGVRFLTLILPDNTRVPIQTETIFREGESPTSEAASKVGASAVVGTILGAIIGGHKGAAIGATAGAAGGTAAVMTDSPNDVAIEAGTSLTVRLTAPVVLSIERLN